MCILMLTISGSNSNVDFMLLAVMFTPKHLRYKVNNLRYHGNIQHKFLAGHTYIVQT